MILCENDMSDCQHHRYNMQLLDTRLYNTILVTDVEVVHHLKSRKCLHLFNISYTCILFIHKYIYTVIVLFLIEIMLGPGPNSFRGL